PAPWSDIYRQFDRIDASMEPAFFSRVIFSLRHPAHARRWALAAAALIVACALFYRFRQTPSVQASELLRKAVVAEQAQLHKSRRIRIRMQNHVGSRIAGQAAVISA